MRPLHQLGKKIKAIFLYLLFYCLGALIVVTAFAWIYSLKGINNSWKISYEIFWTIESYNFNEVLYWIYAERVVNDLFYSSHTSESVPSNFHPSSFRSRSIYRFLVSHSVISSATNILLC